MIESPWYERGACRDFDPELWFPDREVDARTPIKVCNRCAVRWDCLGAAVRNGERYGVWGGVYMESRAARLQLRNLWAKSDI